MTPNRVCTWVNIATRLQLRSVVHHSHASLSINEKLTPNRVCTWVNIATRLQLRSVVHHSHASLSINEKLQARCNVDPSTNTIRRQLKCQQTQQCQQQQQQQQQQR
ncbi:hypothetical protein KSF78_0009572 [Schistosoma japonicum]|nr:hypothetical protein KSF78_0009572 [Schistosoma japonicum]